MAHNYAPNVLSSEFHGTTLQRLSHLGIAAHDETTLANNILEAARTKGATGISTSASLQCITTLLSSIQAQIQELQSNDISLRPTLSDIVPYPSPSLSSPNKRSSSSSDATSNSYLLSTSSTDPLLPISSSSSSFTVGHTTVTPLDQLLIKEQLLLKLIKVRKANALIDSPSSSSLSSSSSSSVSSRTTTMNILDTLGRQTTMMTPKSSQTSSSNAMEEGEISTHTGLSPLDAVAASLDNNRNNNNSSTTSNNNGNNNPSLPTTYVVPRSMPVYMGGGGTIGRQTPSLATSSLSSAIDTKKPTNSTNIINNIRVRFHEKVEETVIPSSKDNYDEIDMEDIEVTPHRKQTKARKTVIKDTKKVTQPPNLSTKSSSSSPPPPNTTNNDNDKLICPVCSRPIQITKKGNPDTIMAAHVERCLRRTEPQDYAAIDAPDNASKSKRSTKSNVIDLTTGGLSSSSERDDDDEDDIFQTEYSDENEETTATGNRKEISSSNNHKSRSSLSLSDTETVEDEIDDDEDVDEFANETEDIEEDNEEELPSQRSTTTSRNRITAAERKEFSISDDWNPQVYETRQEAFLEELRKNTIVTEETLTITDPTRFALLSSTMLQGNLSVPNYIYKQLLPYQIDGLVWLYRLHRDKVGGILGDEMGLGKTVQIAALLGGLKANNKLRSTLVVCPATVLNHWVRELTTWWPPLRVLIMHESGGAFRTTSSSSNNAILHVPNVYNVRKQILNSVQDHGDVVVTTYESIRSNSSLFLQYSWSYVILDEGHRIRNPEAALTQAIKQIRATHRLILTGAPIQNRLRELWSLFDFAYPGRLGTLQMFESQFSGPISAGGWTHASAVAVQTAYQCAVVLRDLISPYLLRRLKRDVNAQLPSKTEQVLFCRLAPSQREIYATYIRSNEVADVLSGRRNAFRAVTILRKICNHPYLIEPEDFNGRDANYMREVLMNTGNTTTDDNGHGKTKTSITPWPVRNSGKMAVVAEILRLWFEEGRRVLLFTQGRQMLSILEKYARICGYNYLRMDGTTPVRERQHLVDAFNTNPTWFLFLLTTRVGGVGVNLIGADRVLIFDPDWNPSTDMQARERAWRLGQRRHVTIYRLITAGTIEEKIYHRQIFKTALTQRILADPRSKRLFSYADLRELFTLTDGGPGIPTDTALLAPEGHIDLEEDHGVKIGTKNQINEIMVSDDEEGEIQSPTKRKDKSKGKKDKQKGPKKNDVTTLASRALIVGAEDYEDPDAGFLQTKGGEDENSEDGEGTLLTDKGKRKAKKGSSTIDTGEKRAQTSMLQALVDGGGLSSVFSHDAIENAGSANQHIITSAKQIAQNALRSLQPSKPKPSEHKTFGTTLPSTERSITPKPKDGSNRTGNASRPSTPAVDKPKGIDSSSSSSSSSSVNKRSRPVQTSTEIETTVTNDNDATKFIPVFGNLLAAGCVAPFNHGTLTNFENINDPGQLAELEFSFNMFRPFSRARGGKIEPIMFDNGHDDRNTEETNRPVLSALAALPSSVLPITATAYTGTLPSAHSPSIEYENDEVETEDTKDSFDDLHHLQATNRSTQAALPAAQLATELSSSGNSRSIASLSKPKTFRIHKWKPIGSRQRAEYVDVSFERQHANKIQTILKKNNNNDSSTTNSNKLYLFSTDGVPLSATISISSSSFGPRENTGFSTPIPSQYILNRLRALHEPVNERVAEAIQNQQTKIKPPVPSMSTRTYMVPARSTINTPIGDQRLQQLAQQIDSIGRSYAGALGLVSSSNINHNNNSNGRNNV